MVDYIWVMRDQADLSAILFGPTLQENQVQMTCEHSPAPRPYEQDAWRLRPAKLVPGRHVVIVRVEVDDLNFHKFAVCQPFKNSTQIGMDPLRHDRKGFW